VATLAFDDIARKIHPDNKQEAQLMLTNPRDAFSSQSRSPNIVPFHMLGSNFVFPVFDFKNVMTLKSG